MRLRETSGNVAPVSPGCSPLSKHVRSRQRRGLARSYSYEAAKYIEHLEHQLATTQTQLESYTSPASANSHAAQLRSLTNERDALRWEVQRWGDDFDAAVSDAGERHREVEASMLAEMWALQQATDRQAVREAELEEELERATKRAKDLERQVGRLLPQVKEAEALVAANIDLERRLDALTQMLALSPTAGASVTSSPTKSSWGDDQDGSAERRCGMLTHPCSPPENS